jgi:polyhydroxybutyrate depolymerase
MKILISFLVVTMAVGCGSTDSGNTAGSGGSGGGGEAGMGGAGGTGGRVFSPDPPLKIGPAERAPRDNVAIPEDYDPTVSYPLVMVLHGAGVIGHSQAIYFQLFPLVDEKQFILVYPDATQREGGGTSWNSAVAGTDNGRADDTAYLSGLIEEAQETYNIDAKRVYLLGHSSGGFMSFRMACEASSLFTALASLAGGADADPDDCSPGTPPVSVLVMHGTVDGTVPFEGVSGVYAGAIEIAERSAELAGCDPGSPTALDPLDVVKDPEGEPAIVETDGLAYTTGCDAGLDTELWTINDGVHIPTLNAGVGALMTDWLLEHSR